MQTTFFSVGLSPENAAALQRQIDADLRHEQAQAHATSENLRWFDRDLAARVRRTFKLPPPGVRQHAAVK